MYEAKCNGRAFPELRKGCKNWIEGASCREKFALLVPLGSAIRGKR